MSVKGLASQAASKGASSSFSSGFMSMPPTQFTGHSHGFIRLGNIPREAFGLTRNRFRPIMTFNNPADFVSGPQNAGDSTTAQNAQGSGSFSTSKPAS